MTTDLNDCLLLNGLLADRIREGRLSIVRHSPAASGWGIVIEIDGGYGDKHMAEKMLAGWRDDLNHALENRS